MSLCLMDQPLDPLARRYLDAQLEGDRMQALQVILDDALMSGMAIPDVHLQIIQPAQHELGRLWQDKQLIVAQGQVATAISRFVMAYLVHSFPREPRNGKKVLIGCVEGELHELGPLMCTDFLEMVGFDVRFFGSNVPTTYLLELIEQERPDLLGLSVSSTVNLLSLQRAVDQIRATFGDGLKIAAGGQAVLLAPLTVAQLGVLQPGKNARELADAARQLLLGHSDAA